MYKVRKKQKMYIMRQEKKVRKAIADIGGMMPEEMPTPKKSLKELERQKKQIENKDKKKLEEMK